MIISPSSALSRHRRDQASGLSGLEGRLHSIFVKPLVTDFLLRLSAALFSAIQMELLASHSVCLLLLTTFITMLMVGIIMLTAVMATSDAARYISSLADPSSHISGEYMIIPK